MEVVIHRKSYLGTQNNVRLQRYAGLQRCRIRQVLLYNHERSSNFTNGMVEMAMEKVTNLG